MSTAPAGADSLARASVEGGARGRARRRAPRCRAPRMPDGSRRPAARSGRRARGAGADARAGAGADPATGGCWCRRSRSTAAPPRLMAADLAGAPRTGLHAQLCGDAHLSNFGAFAAPDRRLIFGLNDFDETLPGPFEWDVKRLVASFAVAGRDRGFDAKQREPVNLAAARSYREAMREFAEMRALDLWYARLDVEELAKRWAARRDRQAAASGSSATSPRRARRTACGPPTGSRSVVDGRAADHQRPAADRPDRGAAARRGAHRARGHGPQRDPLLPAHAAERPPAPARALPLRATPRARWSASAASARAPGSC